MSSFGNHEQDQNILVGGINGNNANHDKENSNNHDDSIQHLRKEGVIEQTDKAKIQDGPRHEQNQEQSTPSSPKKPRKKSSKVKTKRRSVNNNNEGSLEIMSSTGGQSSTSLNFDESSTSIRSKASSTKKKPRRKNSKIPQKQNKKKKPPPPPSTTTTTTTTDEGIDQAHTIAPQSQISASAVSSSSVAKASAATSLKKQAAPVAPGMSVPGAFHAKPEQGTADTMAAEKKKQDSFPTDPNIGIGIPVDDMPERQPSGVASARTATAPVAASASSAAHVKDVVDEPGGSNSLGPGATPMSNSAKPMKGVANAAEEPVAVFADARHLSPDEIATQEELEAQERKVRERQQQLQQEQLQLQQLQEQSKRRRRFVIWMVLLAWGAIVLIILGVFLGIFVSSRVRKDDPAVATSPTTEAPTNPPVTTPMPTVFALPLFETIRGISTKYYVLNPPPASACHQQTIANSCGGRLASFTSEKEKLMIKKLTNSSQDLFWVGGRFNETTSEWNWLDKSTPFLESWAEGEPKIDDYEKRGTYITFINRTNMEVFAAPGCDRLLSPLLPAVFILPTNYADRQRFPECRLWM